MPLDSKTVAPRTAPMPSEPVRQFSFTDFNVNNPTTPPPGDKLDSEIDNTNTAVSQVIDWASVSLNTDGTLRDGSVEQSTLQPGLFDDVSNEIIADVQPLVDQAQGYASSALTSANNADTSRTQAAAQASAAVNAAASASTSEANAGASADSAAQHAAVAGVWSAEAENAANDASGSETNAESYADVAQAWAEHMPDTIPPNILAVMGITGDHWSSRWWANHAAELIGGPYLMLDGSSIMTGPLLLADAEPVAANEAASKSYVDERLEGVSAAAGMFYKGHWNVASNTPDIHLGPSTGSDVYFATTVAPGTPETAPAGIPGIGGTLIENQAVIVWNSATNVWENQPPGRSYAITDQRYVQLGGGTMTGLLTLSGAPTSGLHAATKDYADTKLALAGGTMTGNLSLISGLSLGSQFGSSVTDLSKHISLWGTTFGLGVTSNRMNVDVPSTASIVNVVGGVDQLTISSSAVTLRADPTTALGAATKQYVDAGDAKSLALTGGTVTGNTTFSAGINFGSTADTANNSASNHLWLYGTQYGIGVTGGRLNFIGSGSYNFVNNSNADVASINGTGSITVGPPTDNQLSLQRAAAGGTPLITTQGADANIALNIQTKGTGLLTGYVGAAAIFQATASSFTVVGTTLFQAGSNVSANNVIRLTPAAGGSTPSLTVAGPDANLGLNLSGQGTGAFTFQSPVNLNATAISATLPPALDASTRIANTQWTAANAPILSQQAGGTVDYNAIDMNRIGLRQYGGPVTTSNGPPPLGTTAKGTVLCSFGANGNWASQLFLGGDETGGLPSLFFRGEPGGGTWNPWRRIITDIGGAMTGALTLAADPTTALGAATKQYVDARVGMGAFLVKSTAYTIVATDFAATFRVTATATMTLPASATAGAGWYCRVCNSSPVTAPITVTVQRAGSDTIDPDAATSVLVLPGDTVTLIADGVTGWITQGLLPIGRVIQEKMFFDGGSTTSTTALSNLNTAVFTFQPLSIRSFLVITMSFQATQNLVAAANNVATFQMFETTGTATGIGQSYLVSAQSSAGGLANIVPATLCYWFTNSALTARKFNLYGSSNNASTLIGGTNIVCRIREEVTG